MYNLIRIKQIDSIGLSGFISEALQAEYVSGIIADLIKDNAIIKTGDQTISGVKNFATKPTVNYTGILISGDNAKTISFNHLNYPEKNVDSALKFLYDRLVYAEPNIGSFTNFVLKSGESSFVSSPIEKGSIVTGLRLFWFYNTGQITGQNILEYGNLDLNVTGILDSGTSPTTMPLTDTKTYVLIYGDSRTVNKAAATTVLFQQKMYYGTNGNTSLNNAGILGLANQDFATSRLKNTTLNPDGLYIYFAYPRSFGPATFKVNGFNNSAWLLETGNFINLSSYTENYNVYRSQYIQYGTGIQIEVL